MAPKNCPSCKKYIVLPPRIVETGDAVVADVVEDGSGDADVAGLGDADAVHPRLPELGVGNHDILGRGDPDRGLAAEDVTVGAAAGGALEKEALHADVCRPVYVD